MLISVSSNIWAVEDNFAYTLSIPSMQTPKELYEFTENICNIFESSLNEFNEYKDIWKKNIVEIKTQNFWNHYYYDIDNALYRYEKNGQKIHIFWIKHIFQSLLNKQFYPRLKLLNAIANHKDEDDVFYKDGKIDYELAQKASINREKISNSFFEKIRTYYGIEF